MASSMMNIASVTKMVKNTNFSAEALFEDDDMQVQKKKKGKQQPEKPAQNIHEAAAVGSLSAVILFWSQGQDVNLGDPNQASPLHWAAFKGHLHVVKFLIERGADKNALDKSNQTPLMWATVEGHIEVVEYLLAQGADAAREDTRGCTCHFMAAQNSHLALLHLLLSSCPVKVDKLDSDHHTILTWACYKGQLAMVQYLVEIHNAPTNIIDSHQRTLLHWAAREGHEAVCVYLMSLGLSPQTTDEDGFSAIEQARDRHHVETAAALKAQQVTQTDWYFSTTAGLVKSKRFLLHALCGIAFPIAHFVAAHFIPPFLMLGTNSIYIAKNIIESFGVRSPIVNHRAKKHLLEDIPIPRTLAGAARGGVELRRRDPLNLTLFACLLLFQYLSLVAIGIEASTVYVFFSFCIFIFAALTKLRCFADVLPKKQLKDYGVFKAVDDRALADATNPRLFNEATLSKVPLRAFYCHEIDRLVNRYDSWSLFLDCPLSHANLRWFFFFIMFVTFQQLWLLFSAGFFFWDKCGSADLESFSAIRLIFHVLTNAMPCADPAAPKTADMDWFSVDYAKAMFLPTPNNAAGIYLIWMAAVMVAVAGSTTLRQLQAAAQGLSRMEIINPLAPSSNGGVTSIYRSNGVAVFSEGGAVGNFVAFILGTNGARWKNAETIPAPSEH